MNHFKKFIEKYEIQIQDTREKEFQFAILQDFHDGWRQLRERCKGLKDI
jgi:hypothetical protein